MARNNDNGTSLAKGPVAIIGIALLAYGVTGLIFGGHHFAQHAISGTQNGKLWLGLEGNGWTNLLFAGAGLLLLLGSPLRWGAKSLSLLVGLVLGAAAVIAFVDGSDVLGIFAANGLTELVWAIAAAVLVLFALLPRVGGGKDDEERRSREFSAKRVVERSRARDEPRPQGDSLRSERDMSWDESANGQPAKTPQGSRRAR
jgi:hypothetical protein